MPKALPKVLLAAITFGGVLAGSTLANASIIFSESATAGGTYSTLASFGTTNAPDNSGASGFGTFTVGQFSVDSFKYSDNVPGTAAVATDNVATFGLTNIGTSTVTEYFFIGAGDFLSPTPPILLTSSWSANVVSGGAASFSEFGCVFNNSGSLANSCAGSVTGTTTGAGIANSGASSVLASVTSPYELGSVIGITLAPGQDYQISVTNTATVPEPASLGLLGMGLVGLGVLRQRRRA